MRERVVVCLALSPMTLLCCLPEPFGADGCKSITNGYAETPLAFNFSNKPMGLPLWFRPGERGLKIRLELIVGEKRGASLLGV